MNTRRFTLSTALLGAASLLSLGSVHGQTATATTTPVGYQQVTVAAATDASTPTATVVSNPFYGSAAFAGPVSSVDSATSLTSSSATWTAGQFVSAATPYLLHFKTGNSVGRYFLITANTANQLTVANRGYDLTAVSAASDTFEIVPAFTLGTLFGTNSVPFQTSTSANTADNILLWNGTNFDTYYNNGTNWRRAGATTNQNNTVLYPDEGMYITRRATTALTLTFLGTVPSTTERSDLFGPGSTFVANRFPVNTTLVGTGIQSTPGWLSSNSANTSDTVLLWNGTNFDTYYYNNTNWRRAGAITNQNNVVISAGSALFITRQSTATGTNGTLTQALPYTLN